MAFFVIMRPGTFNEKLKLPLKFGMLHGGKLAERARLLLPSGRVSDVGVVKGSGKGSFWFDDGWPLFVEENRVSDHWLLAFECTGSSSFKVRIYDLTACEIDYPSGGSDNAVEEDDSSVRILDSPPPNPPPQQNPPFAVGDDHSVQNISDSDGDEDVEKEDDDDGELGDKLVKELKRRRISVSSRFCQRPKLSLNIKRAVKEAMEMKRGNAPSFLVVIQKHNSNPQRLFVPTEFYKEHMMNIESVRLERSRGGELKTWDVEFSFVDKGLYFRKGFGEFYADNGLQLGDVCLFEMISEVNVVLQVSISRPGRQGGMN